jgi:hypothetical protein
MTASLAAVVFHVRQQREVSTPLDSTRQLPLMRRASTRYAARYNLSALRDKAGEQLLILVVDYGYLRLTEVARFPSSLHHLPPYLKPNSLQPAQVQTGYSR